jgi:hypothetical protein
MSAAVWGNGKPADEPEPEWGGLADEMVTAAGVWQAGLQQPRRLTCRRLDGIPNELPLALLLDRLDPKGHTILFGAGGVGKGSLACAWTVGLVNSGKTVLIVDYERHPEEWRRRVGSLDPDTLEHVYHVTPTGALWQSVGELRRLIAETGADVVIIDSIVIACAGRDVMDPGTAALYAQAVAALEVPVLSLGHNTKAGDLHYPFGSVFWHNLARLTWSLSLEAAGLVLACRKANNYQTPPRQAVTIEWWEGRPVSVHERLYGEAIGEMALEVLTDEPMTLQQIVDRLNDERDEDLPPVKSNSVRQALKRARELDKCGYRGRGYVR